MIIEERRALFPRGLIQPQDSFRFSLDALLLAYFLPEPNSFFEPKLLDLGTGCGVICFSALLRFSFLHSAVGIDKHQELLDAAQINSTLLGLDKKFTPSLFELDEKNGDCSSLNLPPASFSYITANPPYRLIGTGRLPNSQLRQDALFGTANTLSAFCAAAQYFIAPKGFFCLIFPFDKRQTLVDTLASYGFSHISAMPVHPAKHRPANLILFIAQQSSLLCVDYLPPLFLYSEKNNFQSLSSDALTFCPLLHCNSRSKP